MNCPGQRFKKGLNELKKNIIIIILIKEHKQGKNEEDVYPKYLINDCIFNLLEKKYQEGELQGESYHSESNHRRRYIINHLTFYIDRYCVS